MRISRLLIIAGIAAMLVAALVPYMARRVEAHASLVNATPANNEQLTRPPTRVVLKFSEALERRLTQIQVIDCNKNRVERTISPSTTTTRRLHLSG